MIMSMKKQWHVQGQQKHTMNIREILFKLNKKESRNMPRALYRNIVVWRYVSEIIAPSAIMIKKWA